MIRTVHPCATHTYMYGTLTSEEKRTEPNSILVPAEVVVVEAVPLDEEAAGPTEGGTSSPLSSSSDHSCGVSSSSSAAPERMGMSMVLVALGWPGRNGGSKSKLLGDATERLRLMPDCASDAATEQERTTSLYM